jgi:hypothetical protein
LRTKTESTKRAGDGAVVESHKSLFHSPFPHQYSILPQCLR